MDRIEIGKFGKAQGIKGEIKINLYNADSDAIDKAKTIYVDGVVRGVESVKRLPNGVFIKIKGIDDRNAAERFNGKTIAVDREVIEIPDDSYLIADIIGADVICGGNKIGMLTDILQHGAADVFCVKGAKNFMFPALNKVLLNIDVANKTIEVDGTELESVAVYED